LDLIDRKIVAVLIQDATTPLTQIADRVGLAIRDGAAAPHHRLSHRHPRPGEVWEATLAVHIMADPGRIQIGHSLGSVTIANLLAR
jgi:hypothetical protein